MFGFVIIFIYAYFKYLNRITSQKFYKMDKILCISHISMQIAVGYSLLVFVLEIFGSHTVQTQTFTHVAVKASDNMDARDEMHHTVFVLSNSVSSAHVLLNYSHRYKYSGEHKHRQIHLHCI